MVGPWQVPVADAAVTLSRLRDGFTGEAMAVGERTPVALLDPAAAAASRWRGGDQPSRTRRRSRTSGRSSCPRTGWPPAGHPGEDAGLYDAVRAVGSSCAPPSGSRSRSARTACPCGAVWTDQDGRVHGASPHRISLIVSAFAPGHSTRAAQSHARSFVGICEETDLLVDRPRPRPAQPPGRLSALAQVFETRSGENPPDLDDPSRALRAFFEAIQAL